MTNSIPLATVHSSGFPAPSQSSCRDEPKRGHRISSRAKKAAANAVAETFCATLKQELIHRRSWPNREQLRQEAFDYIEIFYNATRRHSTLGILSPARYEEQNDSLKPT